MNQVPAVVGELVAKWREDAARLRADRDEPEATSLVRCTLTNCADQLAQSLSALTAEAGKGEPELPEPASAMALAAWGPKPDYFTADQMREYARLALSTATPAGEWVLVPRDPTDEMMDAWNSTGPAWEDAYRAMLAASPRGASAGEGS
jgi:hypothetical protein